MRTIKYTSYFFICLFIFVSCNENKLLIGKWERKNDDLKGMQIEIVKNESDYKAKIIRLADNDSLLPFAIGDIKWKDFKLTSENCYDFQDLSKYQQVFGSLFENKYSESYMKISGDSIQTRSFSKGDEIVGTSQVWIRLKK